MRISALASLAIVGLAALAAPSADAQTTPPKVMQYKLEPASAFMTGCFYLCECPIVTHPLKGTFSLEQTGYDPLFTYYRVSDVRWVVTDATTYLTIQGSGVYKVGGEFALQHQLVLDLTVDGGAPQHFDSGVLLGGGEFPRIVIDVSLHQNSACIDTVIHVDATDPVTTAVSTAAVAGAPSVRAAPNPFARATEFRVSLPRAAAVEAVVCDVRGRAVRHLRSGWLPAGVNSLVWDGLRDGGSRCGAGVYFLATRVGAERITRRVVKVE